MKTLPILLILSLFAAGAPLVAHHSFAAEFDATKRIELTGVVTKVDWTNPHVWFYLNVKDQTTGKLVNWGAEMGSPNALNRSGWTRNTIKIGMVVTLSGALARDGSNRVNTNTVLVDGKKLGAASSEGERPQ